MPFINRTIIYFPTLKNKKGNIPYIKTTLDFDVEEYKKHIPLLPPIKIVVVIETKKD